MGLSARLLVLTVAFVMVAEVLIYAPSVGRYRKVYLEERIARAHLAMLAVGALAPDKVEKKLEEELLFQTGTYAIVFTRGDQHMIMVGGEMPPDVNLVVELERGGFLTWIGDAFETLRQNHNRILRVLGRPPRDRNVRVEVIMDETPMRLDMYDYSWRILTLSIVISLVTASLVYVSLQFVIVRPMRRITAGMAAFREDPEDQTRSVEPSARGDEIGIAQRELAVMQEELRAALQQKTRLATLGAAVAKVNHDLRNTLATAQLASDGLAGSDDPEVKRAAERLYDAIDRAVELCSHTLDYVGSAEPALDVTRFDLHALAAEVGDALARVDGAGAGAAGGRARWVNAVPAGTEVEADRRQLYRALSNLALNAVQAGARAVTVGCSVRDGRLAVEVADDGPGLSPKARDKLFHPFVGAGRKGGTGLGLVIAKDIMRAHGGDVVLVETGADGTRFRLELPERRARR
jgi:signal transduction histidine kinase